MCCYPKYGSLSVPVFLMQSSQPSPAPACVHWLYGPGLSHAGRDKGSKLQVAAADHRVVSWWWSVLAVMVLGCGSLVTEIQVKVKL